MSIQYFETLTAPQHLDGVWQLLCKYDHEFIPPLSARENTFQSDLTQHTTVIAEPVQYFQTLKQQSFLIALEHNKVVGFMSFRLHYVCKELEDHIDTIYISTIIVDEACRGRGITTAFYKEILKLAEQRNMPITTRTWSTNTSHIRVLNKIGLEEIKRIERGRGPNIDTVYFRKFT